MHRYRSRRIGAWQTDDENVTSREARRDSSRRSAFAAPRRPGLLVEIDNSRSTIFGHDVPDFLG
jgi:hypothetical protein